jgi:pyridoxal phosphate enzyme (YggS family)
MSSMVTIEVKIKENFLQTLEQIAKAAIAAGRDPGEIKLVVVTKTHPIEAVRAVAEAGAEYLGENYAEEAVEKMHSLSPEYKVQWHMIGHVQSRKAALICNNFDYLHSLDSLKLAERLDHLAKERHRKLPVLLELNLGGEESKFGWPIWDEKNWDTILGDISQVAVLPNLAIEGLMGMAPFFDEPECARPFYRRLRIFRDFLQPRLPKIALSELSMGMSGDFEVAIQEGATWVRIGQKIMGPRNIHKS